MQLVNHSPLKYAMAKASKCKSNFFILLDSTQFEAYNRVEQLCFKNWVLKTQCIECNLTQYKFEFQASFPVINCALFDTVMLKSFWPKLARI